MRVIDLLALLADRDRNTTLWLRTDDQPRRITGIKPTTADDPGRLVLTSAPAPAHALKRWELIMLTNTADHRRRIVYVDNGTATVPVFGFAFDHDAVVLH